MKTVKFITLLLVSAMLFTGCDFFRKIAGKPTSKDIARMKVEAQREAAEKKRIQDSIAFVQAEEAAKEAQRLAEEEALRLKDRFYVILGSFKNMNNANVLFEKLTAEGFEPTIVNFQNGFIAVSAASYTEYKDAKAEMNRILEEQYCPYDIWIYDTNREFHVE